MQIPSRVPPLIHRWRASPRTHLGLEARPIPGGRGGEHIYWLMLMLPWVCQVVVEQRGLVAVHCGPLVDGETCLGAKFWV